MPDCNICVTKITKLRPLIKCPYCDCQVCRKCYQEYCLSKLQSICMNNQCKHTHEHEFFIDNVTKTFYKNEWQTAIKKNLFDEQEAKFFNTQLYISHHNSLTNEIIKSIKERDPLSTQMDIFNIKKLTDDEKSDLDDIKYRKLVKERIRHLDNIIRRNKIELGRMKYNRNWTPNNINQIDDEKKEQVPIVIMSCIKDNCRGLVNSKYICDLCKTNYCKDCRTIKNDNHICKKEDLDTVQYLKKETKPCPKCKVPISKKNGCNQMWCVGCHTSFDWASGQIITKGPFHNPEYYAYLRKTHPNGIIRRNDGDIPCNNDNNHIITIHEVRDIIKNIHKEKERYLHVNEIEILQRRLLHFDDIIRRKYYYELDEIKMRELRINYLLNKINKDKFIQQIVLMNRKSQQNRDYYNIIDMIVRSTNDVIRFNIRNTNYKSIILTQTQIIADLANEAFTKIDKRWNSSSMRIDNMLSTISNGILSSIINNNNDTDELSDIDIDEIADILAPDPNNIYQRGF
jgi:hypothetical protein